ncbi:MFS transporter [Paraburkholderia sediminicola]|uniref:MFS transporter n=1 Tax=Paraburkholderia sediminicola TaxID=458836 RepID=UPI0038BC0D9E
MVVAIKLHASESARGELKILVASTLGTLTECYDFFLYGSLASVLSKEFFAGLAEQTKFIFALLAFVVGFAFRPLGALIFGRLGDTRGRKSTFVVTLVLMECATFGVDLLPGYQQWGSAAPTLLILLRVLQSIGLGGEFGGAAIFVAEHTPPERRGANTSWIQAAGALGMIFALLVVYACRAVFGSVFDRWAWRIPFLLSGVMLSISLYVRLLISESPLFLKMKAEGRTSRKPIAETFGSWANVKIILIALFGLITGVTTVIYTAQIYALFFLSHILRVDGGTAGLYVAIALTAAIPPFWVFGSLSDRIGRKPVILTGCLLGALTYFPAFHAITHYANPALETTVAVSPVTVYANNSGCSFQYTALSFPYHVGNGLVGGFFPAISFAIVSQTEDIYAGLRYPVGFSFATAIVGFLFLKRKLLSSEVTA